MTGAGSALATTASNMCRSVTRARCSIHAPDVAEHGATAKEIAAITGHRTLKEVSRYTADADQTKLAQAAIARLPERNQK